VIPIEVFAVHLADHLRQFQTSPRAWSPMNVRAICWPRPDALSKPTNTRNCKCRYWVGALGESRGDV
jgi:hypothetical protein